MAAADAPVSLSASGQAVVDGTLYVVGGCTTANCTPMSNAVAAYDVAADSWTELADYPAAAAFASCGGIDGKVYCTGGNGGSAGTAASYVYDPGADAWSELPDAPVATWASSYAVANGTPVVNGGVQGAAVANRTFAFDPGAGAWTDLPNSNTAVYRGGMACGLHKVGGSTGGFSPVVDSESLPGYDDCGTAAADVEWLTINKTAATLAPGESLTVRVTTDPAVSQPGTYTAGIAISDDAPGSVGPVEVTMHVTPPRTWGKLLGTVSGRSWAGDVATLAGATVQADSWAGSWTLTTDAEGGYAQWFNAAGARAADRREGRLCPAGEVRARLSRRGDPAGRHAGEGGTPMTDIGEHQRATARPGPAPGGPSSVSRPSVEDEGDGGAEAEQGDGDAERHHEDVAATISCSGRRTRPERRAASTSTMAATAHASVARAADTARGRRRRGGPGRGRRSAAGPAPSASS